MNLEVIRRTETNAAANLAYEEGLFDHLRAEPRPLFLSYVNGPCIVLGRSNRADEWVDLTAANADGIPVLRRFTGGGTVYHDLDNLNFSFIVPRAILDPLLDAQPGPQAYIRFFRQIIVAALSRGGPGYAATGVSDVSLNGRKISGNAQRIAGNLVLHHGTVMRRCPLPALERYLLVPPNRPGVPHRKFVTGLAEEGRSHGLDELTEWLAAALAAALGFTATAG